MGIKTAGRYADEGWQIEEDGAIRCPECEGKVQFRDWQDESGLFVDTHYRCLDCRIDWWADGKGPERVWS